MKTVILILLLAGTAATVWAQEEIAYDSLTDVHRYAYRAELYDYRTNGQQNSYRTVAIKGSPFLYKNWQQGSIPLRNKRSLVLPINYNILEGYGTVSLVDGEKRVYPESFTINDLTFIRIKNYYYQALYVGKTKLLRRYNAGQLVPVKLNQRSLLAKLSDQPGARNIVEEQNLNLRSEKDVIALLAKLDQ